MPTAAFTAVATLKVIFLREDNIPFGGKVIIFRVELGGIGHWGKDTGAPVDLIVD
jgi:hypothetical protein